MEVGIGGRNVRINLNKTTLNQIMHMVNDIVADDETAKIYQLFNITMHQSVIPKNIVFTPNFKNIGFYFANMEVTIDA